ncbi:TPA: phosphoribosylformylglycinamidine synthase, partial [Candidatus Poribacteria bacterium]|nr:phosphoribosylformylglycinamidine synthase [Candidatus Poribacteria bacterium]
MSVNSIDILDADDDELLNISERGLLALNLTEMKAIQDYFSELGRNPTDVELETIAQTWSEHCVHKTFRGLIEYSQEGETEIIDSLLKSTIMKATREINKPWCVSVFSDNAGIIEFDENYNIAFKVETHNHPSAIEPYGGAGTGIGGVIRDPLGTGLGAKPILNTDVFCFGPPDLPYDELPRGTLHPKRIFKGVVAGVRDYGNRMGIPTANGAILFDRRYTCNPLVYCGNVGLIPKDRCHKRVNRGDIAVVVGGRTGRDGIHGVTFASLELDESSETLGSAVQIGNPIVEKKMVDTLLQARDKQLYSAITDCGGGGLSSAFGEMGEEVGLRIDLEKVPLKYAGLAPWEIWISESQERMALAVPPEEIDELLQVFNAEDVEATAIGEFTGDRKLRLFYEGNLVADLDMEFLHSGLPRATKKAIFKRPIHPEPEFGIKDWAFEDPSDLTPYLLQILASPNVASKEWVIRQYDHEVQ